jgi:hypothetical protein
MSPPGALKSPSNHSARLLQQTDQKPELLRRSRFSETYKREKSAPTLRGMPQIRDRGLSISAFPFRAKEVVSQGIFKGNKKQRCRYAT